MSNSDFELWEVAKDKAERYQQEAAQARLAAEFPNADPSAEERRALLLLVLGALGVLLWMLAG